MSAKLRARASSRWLGVMLIILVLLAWQFAVQSRLINTPSLPQVTRIAEQWTALTIAGVLPREIFATLQRAFAGLGLAILVAVPLGLWMGTSRLVYGLFEPLTELIRPIPSAAYVPVAILFLGIGDTMKIVVVMVACLFPILLNTYGAVRAVDPVLVDTGRTFGYEGLEIVRKIVFPAVLPSILTGIRISVGLAMIVSVVAEMVASNNGIGFFILNTQQFFRVPDMFAGILTLGVVGYLLNASFLAIERRLLRWMPQQAPV